MLNYSMGKSFLQNTPSAEWTIVHNFGRMVSVTTATIQADGRLHQVLPLDVIIVDDNTVQVTFPYPVTGQVRIA